MKQIPLTQGKFALVDEEDFKALSQFKWQAKKSGLTFYATRRSKEGDSFIRMHREVLNTPNGLDTDHIDGNGLNNCRSNLRVCTRQQNNMNRPMYRTNKSGYKGIFFHKGTGKWRARIQINRCQIHLGLFKKKEQAYKAYCDAAFKYHGEFANIKNKV